VVEIMAPLVVLALTVLIPFNGLILLGMMNERQKMKKLALTIWKMLKKKFQQ
jgi:hypothetical protein